MPELEWKAPPPSYCQAPVTAAMQERGMHVDRAVALARKAVAEAEEGLLRRADQPREGLDLGDRQGR